MSGKQCGSRAGKGTRCAVNMFTKFFLILVFDLFSVSAPVRIEFMSRGYVTAEIDKISGVAAYNIKLTTELNTEDEGKQPPAKATRMEKKKRVKKPKISKLQHSRQVISDIPEDMPEWQGRGVGMAETFNLSDMNQLSEAQQIPV